MRWIFPFLLGVLPIVACGSHPNEFPDAGADDGGLDGIDPGFKDGSMNDGCNNACSPKEVCVSGMCVDACQAAKDAKASVGCDYWSVHLDIHKTITDWCFATMIANTSPAAAKLAVEFAGQKLDLAKFAKIPQGAGKTLTYATFDPNVGIPPGQVAIVFLVDNMETPCNGCVRVQCPSAAALPHTTFFNGTGITKGFHITTDAPVVAYQMLPFGGGRSAVAGASLLIPTSAWDTNYVAMQAYPATQGLQDGPTLSIVAQQDATSITVLPKVAIVAGNGVAGSAANTPVTYKINAGEVIQISQTAELSGSPIQSDKPIGFFGGSTCMFVPQNQFFCDHAEQQIPAVRALGSEYAVVSYRPRNQTPENPPHRFVGVVNGTSLTYDPPIQGAPTSMNLGDVKEFTTATPFVVKSQDDKHPFIVATYMTGSGTVQPGGYGDPEFVRIVPSAQYLNRYVFFTDPTYPETNLVLTRKRGPNGFSDVTLDCAGKLGGWQNIDANGDFQFTRFDLVRHKWDPQGNCNNGRHEIQSGDRFGLWVWGWGSDETTTDWSSPDFTQNVSYGYPAGENVAPINTVVVPPNPN